MIKPRRSFISFATFFMPYQIRQRQSWDTSIKHLCRHGLLEDILTKDQLSSIPKSNVYRWRHKWNSFL